MAPTAASLVTSMASSLLQPVASLLINAITGKRVTRAGKRQEAEIPPFLLCLKEESQEQEEVTVTRFLLDKHF